MQLSICLYKLMIHIIDSIKQSCLIIIGKVEMERFSNPLVRSDLVFSFGVDGSIGMCWWCEITARAEYFLNFIHRLAFSLGDDANYEERTQYGEQCE